MPAELVAAATAAGASCSEHAALTDEVLAASDVLYVTRKN